MQDADRYDVPVHATPAYVAGFGSSGSMLAGAAALFLVGSAIVAFGGWPQIATGPATSTVAAVPAAASSHASRRLLRALTTTAPRVHAPGAVARSGVPGPAAHRNVAGRTVARLAPAAPTTPATPATGSTSPGAATASVPAPASGCTSCTHPSGSPGPVTTVTNKVAQTVATVGGAVGQQITGLSGTVANPVSAVSPPVGSTVGAIGSTAGSTAGSTVSGTATTAANVVTTVGNVLGGGH